MVSLDRLAARARLGSPGRPTRAMVALVRWGMRPFVRLWYRPEIEGLENLPTSGPFLLVANHSGALGAAEIAALAVLYLDRIGATRPLAGFAHPFVFHVWPFSWLMRGLGAVPSSYAAGEAALAAGVPLLVFPGGDHEVSRPVWRAREVDFAGRKGFLRLARGARVPIVPLGFRGSHYTAPIVWRSRLLPYLFVAPRLFGLKRYPLTLLAVLGAGAIVLALPELGAWRFLLAWAWLSSPLALFPWVPWSIRARVGKPIPADELFPGGATAGDAELSRALERVEGAVRALVE